MTSKSRVIIALDFPDEAQALELTEKLDPEMCKLKVGKELFTRSGPRLVKRLVDAKFDVFLDLKYHDIPNTVASACKAAADLGVWMLNVHALGGRAMMEAAKLALDDRDAPYLIAVTLLTSSGERELKDIGINLTPEAMVLKLAAMAHASGLDGVVCSAMEANSIKSSINKEFLTVTPGIRLAGDSKNDQNRVMTPVNAIQSGANYLVIGRSITHSDDPCKTLLTINSEIEAL